MPFVQFQRPRFRTRHAVQLFVYLRMYVCVDQSDGNERAWRLYAQCWRNTFRMNWRKTTSARPALCWNVAILAACNILNTQSMIRPFTPIIGWYYLHCLVYILPYAWMMLLYMLLDAFICRWKGDVQIAIISNSTRAWLSHSSDCVHKACWKTNNPNQTWHELE